MACDPLNFHPLENVATTAISAPDLLKFIASCGHQPRTLDITAIAAEDQR
jgi:Ala-tRNA(Pro) deacylase